MDSLNERLPKLKLSNSGSLLTRPRISTAGVDIVKTYDSVNDLNSGSKITASAYKLEQTPPNDDTLVVSTSRLYPQFQLWPKTSTSTTDPELSQQTQSPRFSGSEMLHEQDDSLPENIQHLSPSSLSPNRKVGPTVPPKPSKSTKFPEVLQSTLIRQTCEPLYSKRLQSSRLPREPSPFTDAPLAERRDQMESFRPQVLHRRLPTISAQQNIYGKMKKVTLDNPIVLEQQLEALAHHKMQLEKKGLLQNSSALNISCVPKLSTASLLNETKNSGSSMNLMPISNKIAKPCNVYSNVPISNCHSSANIASALSNDGNACCNISMCTHQLIHGQNPCRAVADEDFVNNGGGDFPNAMYENSSILPQNVKNIADTKTNGDYLRNQNDDDIPAPASPVSSSYSELRRAIDIFSKGSSNVQSINQNTNMQFLQLDESLNNKVLSAENSIGHTYINVNFPNEFNTYNDSPSMQGSSTYESIYEPINPRPTSQLSVQSNYLMYVQYVNTPSPADGTVGSNINSSVALSTNNAQHLNCSSSNMIKHHPKEAEVEALTDFLVHSIDSPNDADSYGICIKCNERVVGEISGCTAMEQIYHISCFTCSQCQINLQGKPFYSLENKPYCEYDYLQTLEKCSVCMKPILERILRATGKPYHPQCFTCVVCGNSLDGIPFTVDATNQNYCIADFHKKFAPRCCVCKLPIMPEPGQEETVRVVALDRSFHFECYKCEDCDLLLSSDADGRGCYPLDDHVLCKSCNAQRVQMLTNRMTTEL